ncbi:MAG: MBL fold metallo-hydrolase [Erysipelotrichaceae bacterium]|nr:MBL fold metallo-hydrolase [Erysipelotrichaceae bacterium]
MANKFVGNLSFKETERIPEEERCYQNPEITNDLKAKRIYQKEPIDSSCWAYMKMLRETNRTKRIYDVDPYVEVYRFRENVYGLFTISADGGGDPWMYLINGEKKAMLIDTGFGIGSLKSLVKQIVGEKEVIVVNTHSHYDHAYGNAEFDKVYCHEYEAQFLEKQDKHMWDYLFEHGTGRCIWTEFDKKDLIRFKPYEIIGVPDGYKFDLGRDHIVELIHTGGHSCGHAGFLDYRNRIFFAGDDIVSMRVGVGGPREGFLYGEHATLSFMCRQFKKLQRKKEYFDSVFTGHFVTDLEAKVVDAIVDACEKICKDPEGSADYQKEMPNRINYYHYVEGLGTICYNRNSFSDLFRVNENE